MRAFAFALAALPGVLATATTACNDDNCARDVTGTRAGKQPLATRMADCAKFMTTTVYATPTATAAPAIVYNKKMKRDPVTVKGTMPAYINNCANTAAYSSACSCWGYTSTVVTVTAPTTTVTPSPVCTKGLEWAYYAATPGGGKGQVPQNQAPYNNYQTQFEAANFKGVTPFSTGKSKRISFGSASGQCDGSAAVVDGVVQASGSHSDYSVLQHRGYLAADQTGAYSITAYGDELVLGWFGATAVAGWTTANAQLVAPFGQPQGSFAILATAGDYIPLRVLFVNAQTCYQLTLSLTKPDGTTVILSSDGDRDSNNIITSCSGAPLAARAPAYPAWNSEI